MSLPTRARTTVGPPDVFRHVTVWSAVSNRFRNEMQGTPPYIITRNDRTRDGYWSFHYVSASTMFPIRMDTSYLYEDASWNLRNDIPAIFRIGNQVVTDKQYKSALYHFGRIRKLDEFLELGDAAKKGEDGVKLLTQNANFQVSWSTVRWIATSLGFSLMRVDPKLGALIVAIGFMPLDKILNWLQTSGASEELRNMSPEAQVAYAAATVM
jgi:hypothetical protein